MIPIAIVAVVYQEPDYAVTRRAIEACNVPVCWIDRRGVGSLAKAINDGVAQTAPLQAEFLWIVTNVGFGFELLPWLHQRLKGRRDLAALHPAFESDHVFCQPDGSDDIVEVPFVEFTCPLVRAEVLRQYPLDNRMPYWGHDLDWGYRVRAAGWAVGVDHGAPAIEHTYIRNTPQTNPITVERHARRKASNAGTTSLLRTLYGRQWREVLGWL